MVLILGILLATHGEGSVGLKLYYKSTAFLQYVRTCIKIEIFECLGLYYIVKKKKESHVQCSSCLPILGTNIASWPSWQAQAEYVKVGITYLQNYLFLFCLTFFFHLNLNQNVRLKVLR